MDINISDKAGLPIYCQIADAIARDIKSGFLASGHRLPTVRELAAGIGVSRGTVKHAYDRLEARGLIEMTQGRGTFVGSGLNKQGSAGKKDLAMALIDKLIGEMEALSFSPREIRIFFDLKLREREEQLKNVRVGVVDCNPEALSIIYRQLSAIPNTDIYRFLLDDVLKYPDKLEEGLDMVITTSNHYPELESRMSDAEKLTRMALSTSQSTVLELAKISRDARVGIVCASKRFASIILRGCSEFCTLDRRPDVFFLGGGESIEKFVSDKDALIVPPDYLTFCGRAETAALSGFASEKRKLISFDYQIDNGSLLYLRERIEKLDHNGAAV